MTHQSRFVSVLVLPADGGPLRAIVVPVDAEGEPDDAALAALLANEVQGEEKR